MSWFGEDELQTSTGTEDDARNFFDFAETVFDLLGYDTAADNLRRYRSGEGGVRTYSADEMAAHPAYGKAIDYNRSQFEDKTFTARTGNNDLNKKLLSMEDGEVYRFQDDWDRKFLLAPPSTYLAFGRS